MKNKKINTIRYIYSFISLLLIVGIIIFVRPYTGIYNAIIISGCLVFLEYIFNSILDIKVVFHEKMNPYNIKILLIKIITTLLIAILLFVFSINFVTQIIGYVLLGVWILFLIGQEKFVKSKNDKYYANVNQLNKKRKITTYNKK